MGRAVKLTGPPAPAWGAAPEAKLDPAPEISLGAAPKPSLGPTPAPNLDATPEPNLDAVLRAVLRLSAAFFSDVVMGLSRLAFARRAAQAAAPCPDSTADTAVPPASLRGSVVATYTVNVASSRPERSCVPPPTRARTSR